jgi:hypothetical protein
MSKNKLPINIRKYKNYYVVIDCETYGEISKARLYELTIDVYNKEHKLVKSYVLMYRDVFINPALQDSCYYKDKLPLYFEEFTKEENKDRDFFFGDYYEIATKLNDIITMYNIKLMYAYNAKFDYDVINRMYEDVNNSIRIQKRNYKVLNIDYKTIPNLLHNNFKSINWFDIAYGYYVLDFTNEYMLIAYASYCLSNNYLTETFMNISTKEDTRYRYHIDADHEEWHIGFKDTEDEHKLILRLIQFVKSGVLDTRKLFLNTSVPQKAYRKGLYDTRKLCKTLGVDVQGVLGEE